MRAVIIIATLLNAAGPAAAQESPYRALAERDIKALSAARVAGYLDGEGMGYALAAELNHHPGPRHVLQLADSLGLTESQRRETEAVFAAMRETARALGREIVAGERALDTRFAAGAVSREGLDSLTAHLGRLEGRLRYAHLAAHVALREILTAHQVHTYLRLRGYATAPHRHRGGF